MLNKIDITPAQFLSAFFEPTETVCLRIFCDRRDSGFRGAKMECEAGKAGGIAGKLLQHNAMNRGIYFVVNSGGHADADITRINAVFVENDSLPIDGQLKQLDDLEVG